MFNLKHYGDVPFILTRSIINNTKNISDVIILFHVKNI